MPHDHSFVAVLDQFHLFVTDEIAELVADQESCIGCIRKVIVKFAIDRFLV